MSFESPVSVLYDEMGVQVATTSGSVIAPDQPGIVVLGSGSGGWDYLKFNGAGELRVTTSGTLSFNEITGALNTINDSIGLVEVSVIDVKDAVLEVSSAVENITGGKTLLLGDSNQLMVSTQAATNVSGVVAPVEDVSSEVLAARSDRQGATFFFEAASAGKICFLKFGGPAATNNFTIRMTNFSFFELPAGYGGSVEIIGNSAGAGTLYVSEWSDTSY